MITNNSEIIAQLKLENVVFAKPDRHDILAEIHRSLNDPDRITEIKNCHNPYGDGKAAHRIADHLQGQWSRKKDFRSTATK